MTTPLTILPNKESIFKLAKRAIENATIYNKIVLVRETLIYPNDNFNQVMVALKISELENTIKSLS
jgi:hypothetical protein